MLRNTVKELDAREAEFKKRMEEWTERKEAEESRIHELEQRKETLSAEFEEAKRDLRTIHENLNVLDAKKEKKKRAKSCPLGSLNCLVRLVFIGIGDR